MDEIFGEQNFVATVIWEKVYSSRMDAKGFSNDHDYIIVYQKSEAFLLNKVEFEQNIRQFTGTDTEFNKRYRLRNLRKEGSSSRRSDRPNMFYPLTAPDGSTVLPIRPDGSEGRWRWSRETFEFVDPNILEWVKNENGWQIYVKQFLEDVATKPPSTVWSHIEVGHNHKAVEEIKEIFGESVFNNPKPTTLIQRILQIATDSDSIVLDSFAGSGTTAHAVLALNAEDGGNRRFIMVEQEDYADTLTAERVRRVIRGVPGAKDERLREGYGGTFTFLRLGDALDEGAMLTGDALPSYRDLARYVFFTATGEQLDEAQIDEEHFFVGTSRQYDVYMLYRPDISFVKRTPLTFDWANQLPHKGKTRLVVASHKYLDDDVLHDLNMEYCQLPFAIYRFRG